MNGKKDGKIGERSDNGPLPQRRNSCDFNESEKRRNRKAIDKRRDVVWQASQRKRNEMEKENIVHGSVHK
jgi:hypothetical protein